MKQDIKILELNKQHYFDRYDGYVKYHYSCWGYYDGIRIYSAPEQKNKLFGKKTNAPVSPIWFGTGESIEGLDGKSGKQNIGIFRECAQEDKLYEEFWEGKYANGPFFAVGFIQLGDGVNLQNLAKEIEKLSMSDQHTDIKKEKYKKVIVYFTFDNADMIVLIRSNSLHCLGKTIEEIEKNEKIKYLHSVMGVSEEYVADCTKQQEVLPEWRGINCYVGEKIKEVLIRAVLSGNEETLGKMKSLLQKEYMGNVNSVLWSHMSGHANIVFRIKDPDVANVIRMVFWGGTATHMNPLYGSEIYNIETELYLDEESFSGIKEIEVKSNRESENMGSETESDRAPEKKVKLWCEELICKYVTEMRNALDRNDEGLYSCYRALVQTLNTLMQYEGFKMAKNIFWLVYPAFDMFDTHLEHAMMDRTSDKGWSITAIKESICDFLSAVNAIVYHVVHTDQVFLMVPGYSGTSYSLPIKLCLMYLGIADNMISLLNDKEYKYTCLLTPEMEIRPATTLIDMGMYEDDRLIKFSSSQRSLYMPRHFIMILTHEVAHYVGQDIRERKKRSECVIKTLARYVAEGIAPQGQPRGFDSRFYKEISQQLKIEIIKDCVSFLTKKIEEEESEYKYHGRELERILGDGCQEYLSGNEEGIGKIIYKIPEKLKGLQAEEFFECSEVLYAQLKWMDCNRMALVYSGIMREIVKEIVRLYREVFSDIAAVLTLECNEQTFKEAFDVSEGFLTYAEGYRNDLRNSRIYIIQKLFWKSKTPESKGTTDGNQDIQDIPNDWPNGYLEDMYSYQWLAKYLLEYGAICKEQVGRRIQDTTVGNNLQSIRKVFELFSKKKMSCVEIYNEILRCISDYTSKIQKQYNARNNVEKNTEQKAK